MSSPHLIKGFWNGKTWQRHWSAWRRILGISHRQRHCQQTRREAPYSPATRKQLADRRGYYFHHAAAGWHFRTRTRNKARFLGCGVSCCGLG